MIGARFAGVIAGIRLDQRFKNTYLSIYEKNSEIGGTWFENRYPGLACDIPAHSYTLTLEPKHNWTQFYGEGAEILAYLKSVVKKYKLERFIRLQHCLAKAVWDASAREWNLDFDLLDSAGLKVGEKKETADVVFQGVGGLSRWCWPEIEDLQDFKGTLLRSAVYAVPQDADGKRVAVIGSGSSSIQIVPALQAHAKQLEQYFRGSAWIAQPFASSELLKRQPDASNYDFSEEEKSAFARDPIEYAKFRHTLEAQLN